MYAFSMTCTVKAHYTDELCLLPEYISDSNIETTC